MKQPQWRKSTRSSMCGSCVEVAPCANVVKVRDTKDREGGTLVFDAQEWIAFTVRVRAGYFDLDL